MARRAVLVGVWLAGTAVSVALGWGAVGLVRSNVDLTSSADSATPPLDVVPVASATPAPTSAATRTPTVVPTVTSPPSSRPTAVRSVTPTRAPVPSPATHRVTRTFDLQGGTVQARCDGSAISLGYATPKDDFELTVHDQGPAELSVRFRGEEHESRLDATCVNGTPSGRVREDPR